MVANLNPKAVAHLKRDQEPSNLALQTYKYLRGALPEFIASLKSLHYTHLETNRNLC